MGRVSKSALEEIISPIPANHGDSPIWVDSALSAFKPELALYFEEFLGYK